MEIRNSLVVMGSTGFLGKALIAELQKIKNFEVFAVNRNPRGFHGDAVQEVNANSFDLKSHLAIYPETAVINLVNSYPKGRTLFEEELFANLFLPIVQCSKLTQSQQKFIQLGSYFEFTNSRETPFTYAWSKAMGADLLRRARTDGGPGINILTVFDVYGVGDTRPKLMNFLANHFAQSSPNELKMSNPSRVIFPVHVSDTVRAVIASLEMHNSDSWALTSGPTRLGELVNLFQELSGNEGNVVWEDFAEETTHNLFVDAPRKDYGVPLREGITELLEGVAEN